MPKLTRAEIQKRYRERRDADPCKRAEYLKKRKEKYLEDLSVGKRKLIEDLNERERRLRRRTWRTQQKLSRDRKQEHARIISLTPPTSPISPELLVEGRPRPESSQSTQSRQMQNAHHLLRKKFKKAINENEKLKKEISLKERKTNMYRMRVSRLHAKLFNKQRRNEQDTPRSRTKKLLRNFSVNKQYVQKHLTFHFSQISAIANKYKNTSSYRKKQFIMRQVSGKVIKKYKLKSFVEKELKLSNRVWAMTKRLKANKSSSTGKSILLRKVKDFFVRDDISRLAAGKKNTITSSKLKKQRRVLCDTLANLHEKFINENGKIGYSTFCRLRPFWVVAPKTSDRDTCQCKIHQNLQFIAEKLKLLGYLDTNNTTGLLKAVICDEHSVSCAYNDCGRCKSKSVQTVKPLDGAGVAYYQWETKMNEAGSKVTTKVNKTASVNDMFEFFQKQMVQFKRHVYNINHQYKTYRKIRESLTDSECLIHVDFSENFTCQYTNEIQSVHFGGSHQQATLHTGMVYTSNKSKGFCTISESRQHDPPAIWTHLEPILKRVKQDAPCLNKIHFFSDGPTTQYRQKANFYLLSKEPFKYGFQYVNWNLFESSHGKGAPDGIGGALKRKADSMLKHGIDIPDAKTLFDKLSSSETQIDLYYVPERSVVQKSEELSSVLASLKAIKGTMKLHQIISDSPGILYCRDLSCVCGDKCLCYNLRKACVISLNDNDINPCESVAESTANLDNTNAVCARSTSHDISDIAKYKFCLVKYDESIYPGQILSVDKTVDEVTVKCMKSIGSNKFVWPEKDDIFAYSADEIISFINEPIQTGRRFLSIDPCEWKIVQNYTDYA